jgi:hypothetical protein
MGVFSHTCSPRYSEIGQHAYWMQRNGYSESTIRAAVKTRKYLGSHRNLADPGSFLNYNAIAEYGDNRRCHILLTKRLSFTVSNS